LTKVHSIDDGIRCAEEWAVPGTGGDSTVRWALVVDAAEKDRWLADAGAASKRRSGRDKNLVGKKIVVTMREGLGRRRSVSSNAMLLFVWQPEGWTE